MKPAIYIVAVQPAQDMRRPLDRGGGGTTIFYCGGFTRSGGFLEMGTFNVARSAHSMLCSIGAFMLLAAGDPTLSRVCAQPAQPKPFVQPEFNGCPGPNTSNRRCVGLNRWEVFGTKEGICGFCGTLDYVFQQGSCSGPVRPEFKVCRGCEVVPGSARDDHEARAVPISEAIACLVGLGGVAASLAVAICLITGPLTPLCFGTVFGPQATCYYNACANDCILINAILGEPSTACSGG